MTDYYPKDYDLTDEEEDEKYLRGCREFTRTTDGKPRFLTKTGREVVVDTTENFELFL